MTLTKENKKWNTVVGEGVVVKVVAAPTEGLSSVPSAYGKQLTTSCNSS